MSGLILLQLPGDDPDQLFVGYHANLDRIRVYIRKNAVELLGKKLRVLLLKWL